MINWDLEVLGPLMGSGVFGEDIQPTYMPALGSSFPIDGVFDDAAKVVVILDDGAPGMQTTDPTLGVRLSQFPADPVAGDKVFLPANVALRRPNQLFIVSEVLPDSHGWAKLELNLVSVS